MASGACISSVGELGGDQEADPTTASQVLAALTLSSPRPPTSLASGAYQPPFASNIGCSSDIPGGSSVVLGAEAASSRQRALQAATQAAEASRAGSASLQSNEMLLQQWARSHYSALLGELRKWEVHPNGEINFDIFAASLVSLGFPMAGNGPVTVL